MSEEFSQWDFPDPSERLLLTGNMSPQVLDHIIDALRHGGRVAIIANNPYEISASDFYRRLLTSPETHSGATGTYPVKEQPNAK